MIQYIIGQGIEREELRDEIFVQCMRQATNNPHSEWTDRIWLLMCLAIVAFQPSKLLIRQVHVSCEIRNHKLILVIFEMLQILCVFLKKESRNVGW